MMALKHIKKIAVFRVLQLGDLLCAIPAMRALRTAFPEAEITLLGLPWAASFVERFSLYFNRFIHFPGYPGLPEQEFKELAFEQFLKKMQDEQFDLLIQMQGNGTIVNPLMFELGAKNVAGFYNEESFVDSPLFMQYPGDVPEVERHLLLLQHIGIPPRGRQLEFPLNQKDETDFKGLPLADFSNYICIHPGSRGAWRQWPTKCFAAIADYCMQQGFQVVITGTREERFITSEVIRQMRHTPLDLTGKTNLGAMAVLIRDSTALISNCTGVAHIANALETPSIIISMDGEPQRWAPENKNLHRVINCIAGPRFETVLNETVSLINNCKEGVL